MHNITSPDHSDNGIEHQILALGLIAPRVTPKNIEANIRSEHFFTAAEGVQGAAGDVVAHFIEPLAVLTFCVLVLRNGFTVTGESACASPANFDAEIGRNIARANAVNKIWPLMGYQLKQILHEQAELATLYPDLEGAQDAAAG